MNVGELHLPASYPSFCDLPFSSLVRIASLIAKCLNIVQFHLSFFVSHIVKHQLYRNKSKHNASFISSELQEAHINLLVKCTFREIDLKKDLMLAVVVYKTTPISLRTGVKTEEPYSP